MRATIARAFLPSRWSKGWQIALLLCGVVAAVAIVQLLTANGILTLLVAAILPLVAATVARRWLKIDLGRVLAFASFGFLSAGLFAAIAPATLGLAELLISIGIVLLLYSVLAATHIVEYAVRVYRRSRQIDYRRVLIVAYVLLALACAYLLFASLGGGAMWGLTYEFGSKLLIVADALAGAIFVYLLLGTFSTSRLARFCGALAWIGAGARLGPNLIHFSPTFLLPAFAWALLCLRDVRARATLPIFVAIVAPAELLGVAIIAMAAYATAASNADIRRAAAWSLFAVVVGGVFATLAATLVHPAVTIVSAALDDRLRDLSADGAWPWEVFFPSLTGYFGHFATSLYAATGRTGNMLLVCSAIGESVILGTLVAYGWRRSMRGLFPAFAWALFLLGLFFALPSRVGSIPLPTFALILSIVRPGILLVPAATACSALAGAIAFAAIVDFLSEHRANLSLAFVLVLLAAQLVPNSLLFAPASNLTSVTQWMSDNGGGTLLASTNDDDPWATYGRYAIAKTGSRNVTTATLPPLAALSFQSRGYRGCSFAVNYAAYRGFDAPQMKQFIFVPSDVPSGFAVQPAPKASGHPLRRIDGDVAVYSVCR